MAKKKRRDGANFLEQAISIGKVDEKTSSNSAVQPSTKLKRGRIQQTIYLPPDLATWLKIRAIEEQREISEIATEALKIYRKLL